MSAIKSLGLSIYTAVTGSLQAALNAGFIDIFSGPVPTSADVAVDPSCVLLATISANDGGSTGVTFSNTSTTGVLTKTSSETWSGPVLASGTATFFRYRLAGDNSANASATSPNSIRFQDTVGTDASAGLILTSTALVSGNTETINLFQIQQ